MTRLGGLLETQSYVTVSPQKSTAEKYGKYAPRNIRRREKTASVKYSKLLSKHNEVKKRQNEVLKQYKMLEQQLTGLKLKLHVEKERVAILRKKNGNRTRKCMNLERSEVEKNTNQTYPKF